MDIVHDVGAVSFNRENRVRCRTGQRRRLLCAWRWADVGTERRIASLKALSVTTSTIKKEDIIRAGTVVVLCEPVQVGRFRTWCVAVGDAGDRALAYAEDLVKHSSVEPGTGP